MLFSYISDFFAKSFHITFKVKSRLLPMSNHEQMCVIFQIMFIPEMKTEPTSSPETKQVHKQWSQGEG